MQIGLDSFVPLGDHQSGVERAQNLLEEVELAEQAGLDIFNIGEHHRSEFLASTPAVFLAAAAARTSKIRLGSAVTVLSSDDPVRVFQDFATLDLLSNGRAEIVVGRGSFIESYPLFGYDLKDYDALFSEKLDLLLQLRDETYVHWKGKHRPSLTGQGVFPRPAQEKLPIWLGVGGTPQSFVRAGMLGLPLMVAIIGGEPRRFRPLIDLYRQAWQSAGHDPAQMRVGLHSPGFLGDTNQQAADDVFPAYQKAFTKIGRERGWPPVTREQFDAGRGKYGALLVGEPNEITDRLLHTNEALGGIDRVTMLHTPGDVPHRKTLHAIELLGTRVLPAVNKALTQAEVPALA